MVVPDVLLSQSPEQHGLIVNYMAMSAAATLIYDYSLTVHLEIKFIWFSRWRYTEVLFLLIRYLPFISTFLAMYDRLVSDIPTETCMVTFSLKMCLWVFIMTLAESVLAIRTWAMWCRNRLVGIVLAVLTLANLVVQCIIMTDLIRSIKYVPPPFLGFRGCFMSSKSNKRLESSWASFASLCVVEAVVLSLVAVSAFQSYRQGNKDQLAHVIHRDGILFYIYLLCITIVNISIMVIMPLNLQPLLSPLEGVLYSVLTTRIILNIRNVGNRAQEAELHSAYHESFSFSVPLPMVATDHTELHAMQSSGRPQDDNRDCSVP